MSFHSHEDSSRLNCTSYSTGSSVGTLQSQLSLRTNFTLGSYHPSHVGPQHDSGCMQSEGWSAMDIQLLNDDHEKAILSDLCRTAGTESTPLTTFSYISEYICSNNIDIWPGELSSSSNIDAKRSCTQRSTGDMRFYSASNTHRQIYDKCKRVLESIIARNEQILLVLRQNQCTNKTLKRLH
ncbi:uncharacterized protein LOC128709259 [Anopheles marshallii]|uniref:uncharacterized protein LOC128709259 n=1 Tax=Anopheles marshallii TaxID=1521116 RepID=UPI00237AE4B6|nr:uncharacterized protein LOC128709259 [Anopheles marshallii]